MFNKTKFDQDGYFIIRNLFSKEEIENFRNEVAKQIEEDKKDKKIINIGTTEAFSGLGDLLSKPNLKNILFDDRIVDVVKKALGNDDVVYFGDSSYQVGCGFRGWHRDNIDREDFNGEDWKEEYTLVRVGLYLQNHKKYSGGLKVKKGSHINKTGKPVFIDNESGDLAIWSLKTIHSGNAVRVKLIPNFSFNHLEKYIPSFLKKNEEKKRISLFMTFAIKSNHLERYLNEYMIKTPGTISSIKSSIRSKEDFVFAANKKVEVIDLSGKV